MTGDKYHCFWREPIGAHHRHESTNDFERVQELLKEEASYKADEGGNVSALKVIYGRLLEFEAAEVVTRYKVKPVSP